VRSPRVTPRGDNGDERPSPGLVKRADYARRIMILIVDDFAPTLRTLLRVARTKCEARSASKIARAKEIAETSAPDAAIIDVCLPDGDGLCLVCWLRERWPHLPIAVVTGMLSADVVNRVSRLDVKFLAKPVSYTDVEHFVESALHPSTRVDQLFERARKDLALAEREFALLRWIEAGQKQSEFAAHFGIAKDTVKIYARRLLAKGHADSIESLVIRILREGLLGTPRA
jgi:DNA-binding NarL/FixJ family response regulator